jgi:putative membrane protein
LGEENEEVKTVCGRDRFHWPWASRYYKGAHTFLKALATRRSSGLSWPPTKSTSTTAKSLLQKSKDKKVREFAQRMVTDHSAVQKSVIELAGKLGVKAEDSSTSTGLKFGAADITTKLNSLKGKEFDKFYIDNEVSYHKTVTDAVDVVLIPSAQNGELKSALQGAQPLFLKHLEHARSVQSGQNTSMAH